MSELVPFEYSGNPVRVVMIDGEPWFVLADLCKALGLSRGPSQVAERLDDGVRQTYPISDGLGRTQQATIVSEPGMYEVVIRSDKPEAVTFRRWLTHDVLPTIRKTGSYSTGPAIPADYPSALEEAAKQARRALEAEAKNAELTAKVEQDAPKVDAYEQFLEADGNYSIGVVAKILGTSQNKLFAELRGRGIFIAKGPMRNTPYQKYMHHFTVKAASYTRSDGTEGTSYTPRVRPSGLEFIRRRLAMQLVMDDTG